MPQFDNISAVRKSGTYRSLGSFWNTVFKDRDKARLLVDLDFRTNILSSLEAAVYNLAGNAELGRRIGPIEFNFNASRVFQSGMLVYDDPDKKVDYGTSYGDASVVYDDFRIRYFVMPFENYVPIRIQTPDRTLILGIDFFVQGNRWLFFREDPRTMFLKGIMLVTEAWKLKYRSYISYLTRVATNGNDDLVVRWLRNLQTTETFKLAVAAVGGLGIIRKGGKLQALHKTPLGEMIYSFPDEVVRANYRHTPLAVGTDYPANTIVGEVIQTFSSPEKKIAWWRQIDWRGGIVLDPILPGFSNIPLRDVDTVAYTAGQNTDSFNGSKVHARIALSDDFDSERRYWDKVQSNETHSGIYLNRFLELTEEVDSGNPEASDTFNKLIANWKEAQKLNARFKFDPEQPDFRTLPTAKMVNALDTFFQAYLGDAAMVVRLDVSNLPNVLDVFSFISREGPAGATLIILGYLSDKPIEDVKFNVDILVRDSVSLQPVAPLDLTSTVEWGPMVEDYVQITPIPPDP